MSDKTFEELPDYMEGISMVLDSFIANPEKLKEYDPMGGNAILNDSMSFVIWKPFQEASEEEMAMINGYCRLIEDIGEMQDVWNL